MNSLNPTVLQGNLTESATALWTKLAEYIPNIFGTLMLLIVGYFVSKCVASVVSKVLNKVGIDKISDKVGLHDGMTKVGIKLKSSTLFGKVIFWLIMLTFVISASEALNLVKITNTIDAFVLYLPNIIGAGLIFVLGLMLAHFIKDLIENSSEKVSLEYGKTLATFVHTIIVIVISILAIDQLQLETELISRIFEIVLLSSGVALALSLGFGTKNLSQNIISGVYIREQLKPGKTLEFKEHSGKIVEVGTVNTIVELENGQKIHIPNSTLSENIIKSY